MSMPIYIPRSRFLGSMSPVCQGAQISCQG
jgi:hypothetical protein